MRMGERWFFTVPVQEVIIRKIRILYIALLKKSDRLEEKKYEEFAEKKIRYSYFWSIVTEGEVLYG